MRSAADGCGSELPGFWDPCIPATMEPFVAVTTLLWGVSEIRGTLWGTYYKGILLFGGSILGVSHNPHIFRSLAEKHQTRVHAAGGSALHPKRKQTSKPRPGISHVGKHTSISSSHFP